MAALAPSPKGEAGGLRRCYGKIPKEGSDWPGLDPGLVLEPITTARGIEGFDCPGQSAWPSRSPEEGEGRDAEWMEGLEPPGLQTNKDPRSTGARRVQRRRGSKTKGRQDAVLNLRRLTAWGGPAIHEPQ